jgi:hypothetical protein
MKGAMTTCLRFFQLLFQYSLTEVYVDKVDEAIIEMLQTLYLRVVLEMFSKSDDVFACLQDTVRFQVKGQ